MWRKSAVFALLLYTIKEIRISRDTLFLYTLTTQGASTAFYITLFLNTSALLGPCWPLPTLLLYTDKGKVASDRPVSVHIAAHQSPLMY